MADLIENYEADFIQRGYSDEDMQVLSSSQTGTAVDYADFQKWNSASDASGVDYIPGGRVSVQTDMSLYAQWKMKGKYLQLERHNCTLSSRGNVGQTTDRGQWTIPLKLDWTETSQWELHFRVKPTLNQPFYLCKTTAVTYDGTCKTLAGYEVASEYKSYMLPFEIFLLPPGSNDGAEWDSYGTFQQFTKQNRSAANNWLLVVASFANPIDSDQSRSRPAPSTEGFCSTNRNVVAGNSSFSGLTWKYLTDSVQCKCFYVPVKDVWSDVTIQKDGKYVTVNLKPESMPNTSYETTFQLSYIDQKISVPSAQRSADSSYLCLELGGGYQWKEPRFTSIWHEGYTTGTGRYTESTTTIPGTRGTWHFYTKADDYRVDINLKTYNAKLGTVKKRWWCALNPSNSEPSYAYSDFGSDESTWPLHVVMSGKQRGRCQFDCYAIANGCAYPNALSCGANNKSHLPQSVHSTTIYKSSDVGECGYWKVNPTPDVAYTTRTEITEYHPGYHSTELVGYDTRQTTASPGVWWDFGSTSETYSVLSGEIYFLKA